MTRHRARLLGSAVLALALGAALRLWFIAHAAIPSGDTLLYGDIALSWMKYGIYGFSQPPGLPAPTLIRLPGYPLFLMLCFRLFGAEHYTAVLYVQCVIDLLACLLLADLARRLFGNRAALLTLSLAALCPFTSSYVAASLTETLTCATITLAFYALARWRPSRTDAPSRWTPWNRWLWILSAACACSILLRPDEGLLAAAVLPALVVLDWRRSLVLSRRALPLLAASLCTILPLVPWTIRNARTFHVFQPLAPRSAVDPGEPVPTGFYRWYRTWGLDFASTEDIYWNYDGAPIQIADLPNRAFDSPAQSAETSALLRDYDLTSRPTPELDARFNHLAAERIRTNPIRYYVVLPAGRLVNMLLRPRIEMLPIPLAWWRWHEHPGQTAFAIAYSALNLVYLALGSFGLLRWLRRPASSTTPIAWAMLAYIALRCALLLTLDNSEPRYTLELFPILIVGIATLRAHPASPKLRAQSW
jgi:4-amino-4-deoxy-L-arabinose transferase-like glycosyltransferase